MGSMSWSKRTGSLRSAAVPATPLRANSDVKVEQDGLAPAERDAEQITQVIIHLLPGLAFFRFQTDAMVHVLRPERTLSGLSVITASRSGQFKAWREKISMLGQRLSR